LRPFSLSSSNNAASISSEKDRLLEFIGGYIREHNLSAKELAVLRPGIHPNKLSLLKHEDRSTCGLETLREIAAAIESGKLDIRRRRDQNPQDRDPIAEAVKLELHRQVARIVRQMPSSEIHAKFPNLGKRALTDLRDRLNTCAVRLGIDVAAIWDKHYQPRVAA
jgi:hypothetical protein